MVGEEDGYRHSKWLSFISKRIRIAKELLREDGLIFISIDDNERYNLKLLCDSIFDEKNFVSDFVWINNSKGRQISSGGPVKTYESILLYAKNIKKVQTFKGDIRELAGEMPLMYKDNGYTIYKDEIGEYVIKNELYNTNSMFNEVSRPNLVYNIFYNSKTKEIITAKISDTEVHKKLDSNFVLIEPHQNSDGTHKYHAWRWSEKKVITEKEDLHFQKYGDTFKIYTKIRNIFSTNLKNIITDSTNGNNELNKIIGRGKFDYPKPLKLISRLIKSSEIKKPTWRARIVLDFFAGSGTTGHAVMQLNKEDGGNRSYILCTNNENNICEEVTYQRLKKIQKDLPHNLKYYRTDFVSRDEEFLAEELLNHIYEMIQLENGIQIDGKNYIVLLSDADADRLEREWDAAIIPKIIYISRNVLLSTEQEKLFSEVEKQEIPDYYFDFELSEVGDLW